MIFLTPGFIHLWGNTWSVVPYLQRATCTCVSTDLSGYRSHHPDPSSHDTWMWRILRVCGTLTSTPLFFSGSLASLSSPNQEYMNQQSELHASGVKMHLLKRSNSLTTPPPINQIKLFTNIIMRHPVVILVSLASSGECNCFSKACETIW